jgi:hypothetical protein
MVSARIDQNRSAALRAARLDHAASVASSSLNAIDANFKLVAQRGETAKLTQRRGQMSALWNGGLPQSLPPT